MDKNEDHSILRRLERIDSNTSQSKVILLVMLVVFVIGVFAPRSLIQAWGGTLIVILLGFCVIYVFLLLMLPLWRWWIGSEEEREAEMKKKILASITSGSKTDKPTD